MWKVPSPDWQATIVYTACIGSLRNVDLRTRLELATAQVANADLAYRIAGPTGTLHELNPCEFQLFEVSADEMSALYDRKMAAKGSPGRTIYNSLRMASAGGKCPLCGHREVMTLDHYLPKANFPALAVNPINLVPACTDCNKIKLAAILPTLHPYFDNIEEDAWLHAEVLEQKPTAIRFAVNAPENWEPTLRERVRLHFDAFGLGVLYTSQAARNLSGIQGRLKRLHLEGGPAAVQNHLHEEAQSWRRFRVNCWEAALYAALASSQWYCAGGFEI